MVHTSANQRIIYLRSLWNLCGPLQWREYIRRMQPYAVHQAPVISHPWMPRFLPVTPTLIDSQFIVKHKTIRIKLMKIPDLK
tara:strand:+ start:140 stop:385 length:246 start_codon:yes stop_codon:yes gene_type:complete